jgi:hypothetical protein
MTVPSRSFRNCTRLYCMAGKRIPTVGPSTLLAFRGERTPKNEEFNSILRTPIALEEVNRILLRTTNPIKKYGNLGRNESNVNSPPTLSKDADGWSTQANAGLESATREAESAGDWCGRRESNPHRPFEPCGFSYRPRLSPPGCWRKVPSPVCGLDYTFTIPQMFWGIGAARLVSTPSRLASRRAWLGIAT